MAVFNRRSAARRASRKDAREAELAQSEEMDQDLPTEGAVEPELASESKPKAETDIAETGKPEDPGALPGLGDIKFVGGETLNFAIPSFSTVLSESAPHIDVTIPEPDVSEPSLRGPSQPQASQNKPEETESFSPSVAPESSTDWNAENAFFSERDDAADALSDTKETAPIEAPKPDHVAIGRLEAAVQKLEADKLELQTENEELVAENQELRSDNRDLKSGNRDVITECQELHAEIRDLKTKNRTLQAEHSDMAQEFKTHESVIKSLKEKLAAQRLQLTDRQNLLDDLRRKLAASASVMKRRDEDVHKGMRAIDYLTTKLERQSISADVEASENVSLREKLRDLTAELTKMNQEKLAQSKTIDKLRREYDALRAEQGKTSSSTQELQQALTNSKKSNEALQNHLETLRDGVKQYKAQYESKAAERETQMARLMSDVARLEQQLGVKDEIIAESAQNIADMSDNKDTQHLDHMRLEKMVAEQTTQLNTLQQTLSRSQDKTKQLEKRLTDYQAMDADDLARLEEIIGTQQAQITAANEKLAAYEYDIQEREQRYMAAAQELKTLQARLNTPDPASNPEHPRSPVELPATESAIESAPAHEPTVEAPIAAHPVETPPPAHEELISLNTSGNAPVNGPHAEQPPQAPTPNDPPLEDMTEESIDDMIMDYKLGLRAKIV